VCRTDDSLFTAIAIHKVLREITVALQDFHLETRDRSTIRGRRYPTYHDRVEVDRGDDCLDLIRNEGTEDVD
jgi:hypothetical protein